MDTSHHNDDMVLPEDIEGEVNLDVEVILPMRLIDIYISAKEAFINAKYERTNYLDADKEFDVHYLFNQTLDYIVTASSTAENKQDAIEGVYRCLRNIIAACDRTPPSIEEQTESQDVIRLPNDTIKLYKLANDARPKRNFRIEGRRRRHSILFMNALDYITDSGRSHIRESKMAFLILANEYLQRVAYEYYNRTIEQELDSIEKTRVSKSYKMLRIFCKDLPSGDEIKGERFDITHALALAHWHNGRIHNPTECVLRIKDACEEAQELKKALGQRSIRWWVFVVVTILLGGLGGLLTPRLEGLIDLLTGWFEALRKLMVWLFGA